MQKVYIVRDSELKCHLTGHIVCCSVLQCVAVYCSVLQCICKKYTSCVTLNDDIILQHILCVAVCCSDL